MFAVGLLLMLGGGCFAACGFLLPGVQLPPDQAQNFQQLEKQFHGKFTIVFVAIGGVIILFGIYHIVMSFFVRRAKRGAIYATIATSFLAIGWCTLNTLGGLVMGAANALAGVCFLVVIGAIFVWQLLWLFQALRGSSSAAAAAQYQAQYWQMLQQQQAYGQPTGLSAPPPPTTTLGPPPPPQPPSPDPAGWAYGPQTPPSASPPAP
jgi:hypothetical protein